MSVMGPWRQSQGTQPRVGCQPDFALPAAPYRAHCIHLPDDPFTQPLCLPWALKENTPRAQLPQALPPFSNNQETSQSATTSSASLTCCFTLFLCLEGAVLRQIQPQRDCC